jgi:carboxyl-terminal processing protease
LTSFKRSFVFTVISALVVLVTFLAGYWTRFRQEQPDPYPLLQQASQILDEYGYNPLPTPPALEYGMIRGMLQAYGDPYTSFIEPVQHELASENLQGSFGGIGATLGQDAEGYPVVFPFRESPAAQAGLKEGDRILEVDGNEITPQTSDDAVQAAVRGTVGDTIRLLVGRPPEYLPFEVKIKLEEIAIPSVAWHLDPSEAHLGIIQVNLIAATTPAEIQKAFTDLEARHASAYALDLRDNYGGLLDSGIDVARLFLQQGDILQRQFKGQPVDTYSVEEPGPLSAIRLVVLVNQNTASAAEIIAGALKAQQRAILIGTHTYGKDTIQLVFELQDHSSLHVTAAHWWIPGLDEPIAPGGIMPDIPVEDGADGADAAIQAAIQLLFPNP